MVRLGEGASCDAGSGDIFGLSWLWRLCWVTSLGYLRQQPPEIWCNEPSLLRSRWWEVDKQSEVSDYLFCLFNFIIDYCPLTKLSAASPNLNSDSSLLVMQPTSVMSCHHDMIWAVFSRALWVIRMKSIGYSTHCFSWWWCWKRYHQSVLLLENDSVERRTKIDKQHPLVGVYMFQRQGSVECRESLYSHTFIHVYILYCMHFLNTSVSAILKFHWQSKFLLNQKVSL